MIFEAWEDKGVFEFQSADAFIFDETDYISEGNMWTMNEIRAILTNKSYNEASDPKFYSRAIFTLELVRKHNYYLGYILIPFTCLSCLQIFILIMEPHISDRPYLSICVVLSMAVLMTFVSESMPITSRPVLLSIVMVVQFALGIVVTLYTLITCTLANSDDFKQSKLAILQSTMSVIRLVDLMAAFLFSIVVVVLNSIVYSQLSP